MDALERYIHANSSAEGKLLSELDRETHLRTVAPRMISGHIQGRLLKMLVGMIRPRRVLEIGTFTGYSALSMAEGLPAGATIDTIEVDDEQEELIRSFFARSPYGERIALHIGSALEIAPRLGGRYDLVFMDGDKREYPDYYRMLMGDGGADGGSGGKDGGKNGDGSGDGNGVGAGVRQPLVGSGSWIVADNILWYGKVADERCHDPHTRAIREFNRMVQEDPRTESVILPLRDGLNLIRVI